MNVLICGISGKMGQSIYKIVKGNPNVEEIIGFDKRENLFLDKTYQDLDFSLDYPNIRIVIDFTEHEISREIISKALKRGINVISGTTGFSDKEISKMKTFAKENNSIFYWTPNYSLGYEILLKQITDLRKKFEVIDVIETHNVTKKDKPSGTSKKIAKILDLNKKDIQSVRTNDAIAIHEVSFIDEGEKITITHEILDRKAFLNGFMKVFNDIIEEIR